MLSQGNISIFNKLFFYEIGPVIDPKMRNFLEIIGFLLKNQLYLNLYALIIIYLADILTKYTKMCRKLF